MKPHSLITVTLGGTGHYQIEKHAITFSGIFNPFVWGPEVLNFGFINSPAGNALAQAQQKAASRALLQGYMGQKYGKETASYSAQAFAKIQVSLVTLLGAYWRGTNMDTFLSGLGQNGAVENYSSTKILGVPEQGGYSQLQFDLRKLGPIPVALIGGYGGIWKSNKRYVYVGNILWNQTIQATAIWYVNDYVNAGFEFAEHSTKWKGTPGVAKDYRFHPQLQIVF
jgi:hypothetical protein